MKSFSIPQEMIPAVLDGTKTQHWVLIEPQPRKHSDIAEVCGSQRDSVIFYSHKSKGGHRIATKECPYQIGEKVFVKEDWLTLYREEDEPDQNGMVGDVPIYKATYTDDDHDELFGSFDELEWQPASTMPEWAARIWLEITGIRVERNESTWFFVYEFNRIAQEEK